MSLRVIGAEDADALLAGVNARVARSEYGRVFMGKDKGGNLK
jgi:hypothetical protein